MLPKARLGLRGGPGELVLILGVQKVLEGSGLPPILAGTAEQNSQGGIKALWLPLAGLLSFPQPDLVFLLGSRSFPWEPGTAEQLCAHQTLDLGKEFLLGG